MSIDLEPCENAHADEDAHAEEDVPVKSPSLKASISQFIYDETRESHDKLPPGPLLEFLTATVTVTDEWAVAELLAFAKKALPKLEASLDPRRGFDALLRWRAITALVVLQAKTLGWEVVANAQETARRVERRTAQLVREGQKRGLMYSPAAGRVQGKLTTDRFFASDQERSVSYAMLDGVSDAEFEQALTAARVQGSLTRAHLIRIARGDSAPAKRKYSEKQREELIRAAAEAHMTSAQIAHKMGVKVQYVRLEARRLGIEIPADKVLGKGAGIDPVRIIKETVHTLDGVAFGLGLLEDVQSTGLLDPQEITELVASLGQSLRAINKFVRQLRKEIES